MSQRIDRIVFAEFVGTFAMVLVGTGAMVLDGATGGAVGTLGIAIAFGVSVTAAILAFGGVSGAHINPAVTIGLWASRRLPGRVVGPYILAQCAGALAASGLLAIVVAEPGTLGAALPAVPASATLGMEVGLTAILMYVILAVSAGAAATTTKTALAVGATVAIGSYFCGPICGAAMNPARALGPAVASGALEYLWIYSVGPVAGALFAVPLCRRMCHTPGCCGASAASRLDLAPAP